MIIALIFILTSVFQYILYYKNFSKENKVNDSLITFVVIFVYVIIYPFIIHIFYQKENLYNMPYLFQALIIGGTGIIFALITYIFWSFKKRKLE